MNIGQMMKQIQEMQAKMAEIQEKLSTLEISGQSGGGMVKAVMNGKGEMKKIKIESTIVNPSDVEVLEDLIVAACNDAKHKLEIAIAEETEKMMGGIPLPPGMKLPF